MSPYVLAELRRLVVAAKIVSPKLVELSPHLGSAVPCGELVSGPLRRHSPFLSRRVLCAVYRQGAHRIVCIEVPMTRGEVVLLIGSKVEQYLPEGAGGGPVYLEAKYLPSEMAWMGHLDDAAVDEGVGTLAERGLQLQLRRRAEQGRVH